MSTEIGARNHWNRVPIFCGAVLPRQRRVFRHPQAAKQPDRQRCGAGLRAAHRGRARRLLHVARFTHSILLGYRRIFWFFFPSLLGFYSVFMGYTCFSWALLDFNGLYWVLLSFLVFIRLYLVVPGFHEFSLVFPSFTGFYRVNLIVFY